MKPSEEEDKQWSETQTKALLWLQTMKDGMKQVNDLFGLDLNVEFQFKGGNAYDGRDALIYGPVSG